MNRENREHPAGKASGGLIWKVFRKRGCANGGEGECCRVQSGHCLPSEFGSEKAVREAVTSGKYAIMLIVYDDVMARIIRAPL